MRSVILLTLLSLCLSCEDQSTPVSPPPIAPPNSPEEQTFLRGADLSYVNEMEDCNAIYRDSLGELADPYVLFAEAGTQLVRVRLWHTPDWTDYSDFADVCKTIKRAKQAGMDVLLDFHYSDDWADPGKQEVPAAWLDVVDDTETLADSVYHYTYTTLQALHTEGLLPEYVQVGNETNVEILQVPDRTYTQINWSRNAILLRAGLRAVRTASMDFEQDIALMLHIAQPENAEWWFAEAKANGMSDYDWIAISYYPKWSTVSLVNLDAAIENLRTTYRKKVMVVETAYPYTLESQDQANNILGADAAIPAFPISEEGQYAYLKALEDQIVAGGGSGLVYWEPAWVTNSCSTRWGQGSHWENATLFRADGRPTLGMRYYRGE